MQDNLEYPDCQHPSRSEPRTLITFLTVVVKPQWGTGKTFSTTNRLKLLGGRHKANKGPATLCSRRADNRARKRRGTMAATPHLQMAVPWTKQRQAEDRHGSQAPRRAWWKSNSTWILLQSFIFRNQANSGQSRHAATQTARVCALKLFHLNSISSLVGVRLLADRSRRMRLTFCWL